MKPKPNSASVRKNQQRLVADEYFTPGWTDYTQRVTARPAYQRAMQSGDADKTGGAT